MYRSKISSGLPVPPVHRGLRFSSSRLLFGSRPEGSSRNEASLRLAHFVEIMRTRSASRGEQRRAPGSILLGCNAKSLRFSLRPEPAPLACARAGPEREDSRNGDRCPPAESLVRGCPFFVVEPATSTSKV